MLLHNTRRVLLCAYLQLDSPDRTLADNKGDGLHDRSQQHSLTHTHIHKHILPTQPLIINYRV